MKYIALLRGVNVGGNKGIPMAELRAMCEALGFRDVRTLLNSGNVVFAADKKSTAAIERQLEAEIADRLGVTTEFHVRTAAELEATIERNPFEEEARSDPARLHVLFMKREPNGGAAERVRAAIVGRERIEVRGREAFLFYPDGMGTSKLTPAVLDRALGERGTARNWNTVTKLAALVRP